MLVPDRSPDHAVTAPASAPAPSTEGLAEYVTGFRHGLVWGASLAALVIGVALAVLAR